jgi:hypothetical protein
MGGFVSSPAPAAQPEGALPHDGWYPGITLEALRDTMRIPTVVTAQRLTAAANAAMLTVSRELRLWKAAQIAIGAVSLEAVLSDQFDWPEAIPLLYERAVYSFAAADIAETHSDISATNDAKDRSEARVLTADEHRRNGTHAIRDILGTLRTTVELI